MTKSISLTIMRTESLLVKLSVSLSDGKGSNGVYSIYETDMYDYITVNLIAYVVIQYKPKTQIPWDSSQAIKVNEMSMFTLLRGLKDFYTKYQRPDLFTYYQSGMIDCNATDNDKVIISLVNRQFIELYPQVIIDRTTNMVLPGVVMKLNHSDNEIQLSSDEFEAFMYKLNRFNIQSDALNLVTMAMLMEKDGKSVFKFDPPKPDKVKHLTTGGSIFQRREPEPQTDFVIDNRTTVKPPTSLDDL